MKWSTTLIITLALCMLAFMVPTAVAASGDRLVLGHVTLTLPGAVDATDVSANRDALFECTNGPATCTIDVLFVANAASPYDRQSASMMVRTSLADSLSDEGFTGNRMSSFDYTTGAGVTGIMSMYSLTNQYGVGFIEDTFTMVDGGGNARLIQFLYKGTTAVNAFNDGQHDWYDMIDGLTTHGS